MATPSKRKALSLTERVKAVELLNHGMSCKKVADYFGVGKTQVQSINKRKREVLDEFDNNCPDERKRKVRKTGNEDINSLVWEWFKEANTRTIVITGPMIKEKALKFSEDLGIDTFKASNGWLDSFVKRHGIKFGNMCGESGDVDITVVDEWKDKLPTLCKGYGPRDIYNMDETGLFFRATTAKSFHVNGDKCSGGKMSKERLTVALCANMLGDKQPAVVIGKSAQPRCFKKFPTSSLPVKYYSNKKAWMTSAIFEDWVKSFDKQMRREGRHVLLFLDNAPSHPHLELQNVKLQFLPPNTTCKSQPMDQGIIQAVKLKYRKRQLQQVLKLMDQFPTLTGSQLLKKVTVLDSIYWLNHAWKETDVTTISKCFSACGFVDTTVNNIHNNDKDNVNDDDDDDDDDIPLEVFKLSSDIFGVPFEELKFLDGHLSTCIEEVRDWDTNAKVLLEQVEDDHDDDDDNDDCDGDDDFSVSEIITKSQANIYLEGLRKYAQATGNIHIMNSVMDIEHHLIRKSATEAKQSKISNFFRKHEERN